MGKSSTLKGKKSTGSNSKTTSPSSTTEHQLVKHRITLMKIALVCIGVGLSWVAYHFNGEHVETRPKSELSIQEESPTLETVNATNSSLEDVTEREQRPKYWFYMARGFMWIFFSVDNVLTKLGLEKTEITVKQRDEKISMDWDLLWSYDYFHEIPIDYSQLKYHQKINHIPGNYILCMKDQLAINTHSKYIPPGFNNSKSLREYADKHPNTRFVQKLWSNRGVELKSIDEIEFSVFGPGFKYFA